MRRARRHPSRMRVRGLGNSARGGESGRRHTLHTLLKHKTSHLHKTSAQCARRERVRVGLVPACVRACAQKHLQDLNVRVCSKRACVHACVSADASVGVSGCDERTTGSHIGSECTVQSLLEDEQMEWCVYFNISSQQQREFITPASKILL